MVVDNNQININVESNLEKIDEVQLMYDKAVKNNDENMIDFMQWNFPKYQSLYIKCRLWFFHDYAKIRSNCYLANKIILKDLKNNTIDNTKFIFEHCKDMFSYICSEILPIDYFAKFDNVPLILFLFNNNYTQNHFNVCEILYHQLNLIIKKNNHEEIENCFNMCYDRFTITKSRCGTDLIIKSICNNNFTLCDIIMDKIGDKFFITGELLNVIYNKSKSNNLDDDMMRTLSRICKMIDQNKIINNNNNYNKNNIELTIIQHFCDYIPNNKIKLN